MNYYNEIKNELINNEITKRIKDYSKNKSDLETYYRVGKMLSEAGKHYGEGIIKEYSSKLRTEVGKKYSVTNLKYMRKFYIFAKSQTLSDQLTWSHYIELLSITDINKINYYIMICEQQNLSVRELRNRIRCNEYERLEEKTKNVLINDKKTNIKDFIKNPIVIRNNTNYSDKRIRFKEFMLN